MLVFNHDELKKIKTIISSKKDDEEVEFRIQTPISENKYESNISELYFTNLLSYLKEKYPFKLETNKVIDYSTEGKGRYRIIETYESGKHTKTEYNYKFQQKIEGNFSYDVNFYFINLRLSKSIDRKISKAEFEQSQKYFISNKKLERYRGRYIFNIENNIEIHLTGVKSGNKKTYECEFEIINPLIKEEFLLSTLNKYLSIMLKVNYLPTSNEVLLLKKMYNSLIHNSPENVYRNELINIKLEDVKHMKYYNVSNKLDGSQYYLMFASIINDITLYIFNPLKIDNRNIKSLIVFRLPITYKKLSNTIIAGELTEELVFNCFDTMVYQTKNITNLKFTERLHYIDILLNEYPLKLRFNVSTSREVLNFEIVNKQFFKCEPEECNLYFLTLSTISYMNNKYINKVIEDNDGIVFIPENSPYINNGSKKFKFVSRMSFDFELSDIEEKKEEKIFKLLGTKYPNKVPFYNSRTKNNSILIVNNTIPEYEQLKNGIIVETKYDLNEDKFIFLRIRKDKTYPNAIRTLLSVWNDIINPIYLIDLLKEMKKYYPLNEIEQKKINEDEILEIANKWEKKDEKKEEKCLTDMRKYHNKIKRKLINDSIGSTEKNLVDVIDIGGGKLGDIDKYWETNKINRLYVIEPNKEFIDIGKKRIDELIKHPKIRLNPKAKNKTFFIDEPLQNVKTEIKNKVAFITAFFSLTFLFGSEKDVNLLVDFVSNMLIDDGYFIGTVMDGDKTRNLLDIERGLIKLGTCGSMKRLYNPDELKNYGDKIEIQTQTATVSNQVESLVYFDILVEKFKNKRIKLEKSGLFNPSKDLSPEEYLFSSLNRYFIFKKESHPERTLEMLNENVIETFDNEVDPDTQLVRVGTLGQGHCFYHAYLYSVSEKYRNSSTLEKNKMTLEKRKEMANLLTLEDYEKLKGTVINEFEIELRKIVEIDEKEFEKIIYNVHKTKPSSLKSYISELKKELKIDFDEIITKNYENFKELIKSCEITTDAIPYLMDKLQINIIMLQDIDRKLYNLETSYNDNNLYIIMLNLSNYHYESCGILYSDRNNRAIIDYVLYPTEKFAVIAKKFVS